MDSAVYFNIDNGFLEGVVRGFRSGILTQTQYLNLTQCETLDGGQRRMNGVGAAHLPCFRPQAPAVVDRLWQFSAK